MANAEVTMIPQNYVTLTDEEAIKKMNIIIDRLDEDEDVQQVYHNWDEQDQILMNTVLFDLDGTLLPMDMKEFTDMYIKLLSSRLESSNFDSKKIVAGLWVGVKQWLQTTVLLQMKSAFGKLLLTS